MAKMLGSMYADLIIANKRKIEEVAEIIKPDTYFYLVKKNQLELDKIPEKYRKSVKELVENEKN